MWCCDEKTALAVILIICAIFSLMAVESQIPILVKANAIFHIGDVEILTPENRTYYSSTIILSYHATFFRDPYDSKHRWIVYSLDGGRNITVYDEYNNLESYDGNVNLSGLSAGRHIIDVYSKNGTFAWGTSLSGGWSDIADRVYFTIDLSGESSTPAPTLAPTSKPIATPELIPTPTPTPETESFPTSLVMASSVTVAVVLFGVGLLVYGIKRK